MIGFGVAAGAIDRGPVRHLVVEPLLDHGRHVRQRRRARLRGHRQRPHHAGFDVLRLRRHAVDQHLDPAGQEIGHDAGIAAIRHVHDVDAGGRLEQLAGEVNGRSRAGRPVAELSRIGLRQRDELLEVLRRQRRD